MPVCWDSAFLLRQIESTLVSAISSMACNLKKTENKFELQSEAAKQLTYWPNRSSQNSPTFFKKINKLLKQNTLYPIMSLLSSLHVKAYQNLPSERSPFQSLRRHQRFCLNILFYTLQLQQICGWTIVSFFLFLFVLAVKHTHI